MLGTIVNALAIVAGGALGLFARGLAPERLRGTVMKGMGLCVILIGMRDAFKTNDMMCVIVCIALGAIIGETARIEARLEKLGGTIRERFAAKSSADSTFVEGFVTASLVYCTGAMAIVGSLEGGLNGVHNTLYAKSLLDGVTAVFFASTLGSGVLLSAAPVFLYQGAIAMLARLVAPLLTDDVVREMSAVGGLLIVGIGFNLTEAAKIRVGNLMPATFLPLLYIPIFR